MTGRLRKPHSPLLSFLLVATAACTTSGGASPAAPPPRESAPAPSAAVQSPRPGVPLWVEAHLSGLELASADAGKILGEGPHVLIDQDKVLLDGEEVASVPEMVADGRQRMVGRLFDALMAKRVAFRSENRAGELPGAINYWIDKRLPALVVKNVFQTAAYALYPNGSFIVRSGSVPDTLSRLPVDGYVPGPSGGIGIMSDLSRLPPEVVQGTVRSSYAAIHACYEIGLGKNPHLTGRVVVRFVIDEAGKVSEARDEGSTMPDAEVLECVLGVFRRIRFPPPKGGSVTVVLPLVLEPK